MQIKRNMNQAEKNTFKNVESVDNVIDTVETNSCDNNFKDNSDENVNKKFEELISSLADSETNLDELLCDKNNDEDFGFESFKFGILPSEAATSFNQNKLCYESASVKDDYEKQIIFLRGTLEMILGDKFEMYEKVMQDWFADKIEYEDYDKLMREHLSEEAVLIHNRLIMAILSKSCQPFDNSSLSNFDHFTFDKVLEENLKSKSELSDNQSESSIALFNEENEEDEEMMVMIKKRRNKRKSRFKILDDEEDDGEEVGNKSTFDDEHKNPNSLFKLKKKRRTMLITSDDEDDGLGINSINDADSSNSNNVVLDVNNESKSIDIKSSGLLKTTLTIKRNFQDVAASSQSSQLDQLLSSDTSISLLPQPNSELNNSHPQPNSKMPLNIQNSISNNQVPNSKIGSNNNKAVILKSQLLKQCLTNVPSVQINSGKVSSQKLNASLLSNTTIASTDLFESTNKNAQLSPSLHSNDIHNSRLFDNNQGTSLLIEKNECETTNNSNSNSKIVELLNRKSPSTTINEPIPNNNKLSSATTSQNSTSFSIESLFDSNDDHNNSNNLLDNAAKPKSKAKSSVNKDKKRIAKKKISPSVGNLVAKNDSASIVNGFVGNDFDSRSVQSFEKYDPIIDGHHSNSDSLNNYLTGKEKIKNEFPDQQISSDVVQVRPMSPQERISKLKSCFQDVSLPDSIRLGLRISEYASQNGLSFVDKRVSYVCNIALKNFIKNILIELSTSRSSFALRHNRIQHHFGNPPLNPYLPNSFNVMQKESYLLSDYPPKVPYPLSYNSIDANGAMVLLDLRPRARSFGLERNQLHFTSADSGKFDLNKAKFCVGKFRTTSGSFFAIDNKMVDPSSGCTLRHLYNILNTNRSLIPVHSVWSKALYRTIAAFNNVEDYNIIDK